MSDVELGKAAYKGLYRPADSPHIWMSFYDAKGKRHRESTGTTDADEAAAIRTAKLGDVRADKFFGAAERRVSMGELFDDFLKAKRDEVSPRTYERYERDVRKLEGFFGRREVTRDAEGTVVRITDPSMRMSHVSTGTVKTYIQWRKAQYQTGAVRAHRDGGWKATLNRELTVLNQTFEIAVINEKIKRAQWPEVIALRLDENPARSIQIDPQAADTLIRHMPEGYALAFDFACWTGWRKTAILALKKTAIQAWLRRVKLPPELNKNRRPAQVPLFGKLRGVLDRAATLPGNTDSPYVFTHAGHPLRNLGKVWPTARAAAAAELRRDDILEMWWHDTCRVAAHRYRMLGLPPAVALAMFGRSTESMLRRYGDNLLPEDLDMAGELLDRAAESTPPMPTPPSGPGNVVAIRRRRSVGDDQGA